ncbi:nucleoside phosphorylase [Vibrio parahaemolyticus]|nr:nucleoside phosphorylase [Vibrio parahaemolyticus]MDF4263362.1 nucleoside phosphorylase [Vibrio parahaemolyticus]MDF4322005.1 nucleoside phosphorylase [Vibrio parahaemolyticus]MDG2551022.1 nucleoside phosphorylase [Vibrio parahaemolyticus]HCG7380558.1 nucleoside phosphorylase [Vibrio parahaemolyticus]
MKVLVVEDNPQKLSEIKDVLSGIVFDIEIKECNSIFQFNTEITKEKFDLVVADLLLPIFDKSDEEPQDVTSRIIELIRDYESKNYKTPVIAITQFSNSAESNFCDLNKHDINVITYEQGTDEWKSAFVRKIESCVPKTTYDFIIVCALEKEASAYIEAGYAESKTSIKYGLSCQDMMIEGHKGLIIVPPRMGLVNTSIVSARAIDLFEPKIICMSGICAGIEGNANIYDIVIPSQCDQHDAGKWTSEGFVPESYSIPLIHDTEIDINRIVKQDEFIKAVAQNVHLAESEMVDGASTLDVKIYTAPTSSGNSVIADEKMLEHITSQHRKKTAFEMESYALYEAARRSPLKPNYFSAKSVVDNGDTNKGDEYHRVAALISAKAVYGLIKELI